MGFCYDCKQRKDSVKLCQGDLIICKECNDRRFPPAKKPSFATALLAVASPLRAPRQLEAASTMPSPILPRLDISSDITTDEQVTVPKIKCTETCQKVDTSDKSKPLECLLCQDQFHKPCVGIKASSRPSAWICQSCRDIPRTLQLLSQQTKAQEKVISDLRNDNATLTQLMEEQRAHISDLQDKLCKNQQHELYDKKDTTVTKPTLIIGDSVIKDINHKGLKTLMSNVCEVLKYLI